MVVGGGSFHIIVYFLVWFLQFKESIIAAQGTQLVVSGTVGFADVVAASGDAGEVAHLPIGAAFIIHTEGSACQSAKAEFELRPYEEEPRVRHWGVFPVMHEIGAGPTMASGGRQPVGPEKTRGIRAMGDVGIIQGEDPHACFLHLHPQQRFFAKTRGTGPEFFVEVANLIKYLAANAHVGTDQASVLEVDLGFGDIGQPALVHVGEPRAVKFLGQQDAPSDRVAAVFQERTSHQFDPIGRGLHIVIGKEQYFSTRRLDGCILCSAFSKL